VLILTTCKTREKLRTSIKQSKKSQQPTL